MLLDRKHKSKKRMLAFKVEDDNLSGQSTKTKTKTFAKSMETKMFAQSMQTKITAQYDNESEFYTDIKNCELENPSLNYDSDNPYMEMDIDAIQKLKDKLYSELDMIENSKSSAEIGSIGNGKCAKILREDNNYQDKKAATQTEVDKCIKQDDKHLKIESENDVIKYIHFTEGEKINDNICNEVTHTRSVEDIISKTVKEKLPVNNVVETGKLEKNVPKQPISSMTVDQTSPRQHLQLSSSTIRDNAAIVPTTPLDYTVLQHRGALFHLSRARANAEKKPRDYKPTGCLQPLTHSTQMLDAGTAYGNANVAERRRPRSTNGRKRYRGDKRLAKGKAKSKKRSYSQKRLKKEKTRLGLSIKHKNKIESSNKQKKSKTIKGKKNGCKSNNVNTMKTSFNEHGYI